MPTEGYWSEPLIEDVRTRLQLNTLESLVHKDDCVRLFDEVLNAVDWSAWLRECNNKGRGQPPYHPRDLAAAILYGLYCGIRSSRKVEEACRYRYDFMWLLEMRHPDFSTLAKFRTRYHEPLKSLFRQLAEIAMTLGLLRLGVVAFDGTRVKASNSRFKTRTAATLEAKLQALDELYEHLLAEAESHDAEDANTGSTTQLPEQLVATEDRRKCVRQALEKVRAADEARRRKGVNPKKNPAQIPVTDPDSRVMPNKEGGYAPHYTPVATTDGQCGFIVDCDVTAEVNESPLAVESVDRITSDLGQQPKQFLTDAGNLSGQIQAAMAERGVDFFAPVTSNQPRPGNPAYRDDPTQPVPTDQWPQLPRNDQGHLAKSCFVYDAERDQYYCPQGKSLPFEKTKSDARGGEQVTLRVYRCLDCGGCPFAAGCLSAKNIHGRTITRDEYEEVREQTAARMDSESARKLYNQRPQIAETPFGYLKSVMGLRQFLLRGLDKVKTEWRWACTAFNLGKLVRHLARLRAKFSAMVAEA